MSQNGEDLPLIYGTEFQARALCAQSNADCDPMPIRFMVGTQSLKNENQVHLLEYLEEVGNMKNSLSKVIFKHPAGEIWDINCSPKFPNLFSTCYSSNNGSNVNNMCTIWKPGVDISNQFIEEDNVQNTNLVKVNDFNEQNDEDIFGFNNQSALWHPDDGNQLLTLAKKKLLLWDINNGKKISDIKINFDEISNFISKPNYITKIRWSPHSNCSIVGLAVENKVCAKDLRIENNNFAWIISGHSQQVRNLDFNPNAQYYLATCGDDCEYKLWDVRNAKHSVISMKSHNHWVWSVRYNQYHDQLLLTCSSDSRVILTRVASFASQPFGHLLDADETIENISESSTDMLADDFTEDTTSITKRMNDEVVNVYVEHEDSVYAVEWSNADPWIFASLSYDGRLVINKVPKEEKYNLLI